MPGVSVFRVGFDHDRLVSPGRPNGIISAAGSEVKSEEHGDHRCLAPCLRMTRPGLAYSGATIAGCLNANTGGSSLSNFSSSTSAVCAMEP